MCTKAAWLHRCSGWIGFDCHAPNNQQAGAGVTDAWIDSGSVVNPSALQDATYDITFTVSAGAIATVEAVTPAASPAASSRPCSMKSIFFSVQLQ